MQDRARCRFIPRARRRVSTGSRALRRACSRPYNPHPTEAILEAFLVSLGIVALAEIGDKTQLLALVLAARYRRPVPVILGILVATLANHALAAWFAATLVAFFLVEMGDKTQIATAALAARYASIAAVVAGTTLGMMLADVPAVYFGERILRRVPAKTVRRVAAAGFAVLGALALIDVG